MFAIDEFFEHVESEAILDQCAIKQFHHPTNVELHYERSDHPNAEVGRVFASAPEKLAAIGDSLSIPSSGVHPTLATGNRPKYGTRPSKRSGLADGLGYRFASDDFDTMGY